MTPSARVQCAIDILDIVLGATRDNGPPADRIVADWFRTRRFAGSKDRRAVRELVYAAIRACGPVPESGRAAMLRLAREDEAIASLFDGSQYGPAPIRPNETPAPGGIAPEWLVRRLAASGIEGEAAAALLDRAPLDLRVNTLKAQRDGLSLPVPAEPTAAPNGLRLSAPVRVEDWAAYKEGLIEVQDTGSQLACTAVAARAGETIVDLCAGAGGKTLSLAAAMENRGTLIASDTDRGRLSRLRPRADRAGAAIVQEVLLDPGKEAQALERWNGHADAVLVDAPCSGTGTWRRNPEARWRLSEAQLARHGQAQARLLDIGANLVREGGRLIFVTCSLLDSEGQDQIAAFLERHPRWRAEETGLAQGTVRGNGRRLDPFQTDTDGFFIARLGRV